ncbi:MAG: DUF2889 domain-containing protein [Spirochaetia bacterium]
MQSNTSQTNGRPVASRVIEMESYESGPGRIVTEGLLRDDRHIQFNGFNGEAQPTGRFHSIKASLVIDVESMRIEQIDVELQDVPHAECRELRSRYSQLQGLHIESGFTRAVLQLLGGNKGCAHLTHLIITMGPAIVQAAFTYQTRSETAVIPSREQVHNYFIDSCHIWRAGGKYALQHG